MTRTTKNGSPPRPQPITIDRGMRKSKFCHRPPATREPATTGPPQPATRPSAADCWPAWLCELLFLGEWVAFVSLSVVLTSYRHHYEQNVAVVSKCPAFATSKHSCCSHINSHNQIRGHRTGSSHSGAEEYPGEKTQRWYTHISQLTLFMPPPETYKSEIGS